MKLHRKQILVGIMTACLVLTGCSAGGSAFILSATTVTGKVTNVNGKDVTLTLGVIQTRGAGGMFNRENGASDGTMPTKPNSKTDNQSSDSQSSNNPSSDSQSADNNVKENQTSGKSTPNGEMPDETMPSGAPQDGNVPGGIGQGQSFVSGETTASITISDASIIYVEDTESEDNAEKQGSLSDVIEGAVLSIELDKDGKITKITVLNVQSRTGSNTQPEASGNIQ